jgi:hypothetical protein
MYDSNYWKCMMKIFENEWIKLLKMNYSDCWWWMLMIRFIENAWSIFICAFETSFSPINEWSRFFHKMDDHNSSLMIKIYCMRMIRWMIRYPWTCKLSNCTIVFFSIYTISHSSECDKNNNMVQYDDTIWWQL